MSDRTHHLAGRCKSRLVGEYYIVHALALDGLFNKSLYIVVIFDICSITVFQLIVEIEHFKHLDSLVDRTLQMLDCKGYRKHQKHYHRK